MRFAYTVDLRIGETGGGWKLLFVELAKVGESMLPLNVYVCPSCRKVDLFACEEDKCRLLCASDRNTGYAAVRGMG
jgi:hypothetical protein